MFIHEKSRNNWYRNNWLNYTEFFSKFLLHLIRICSVVCSNFSSPTFFDIPLRSWSVRSKLTSRNLWNHFLQVLWVTASSPKRNKSFQRPKLCISLIKKQKECSVLNVPFRIHVHYYFLRLYRQDCQIL